MLNAQRLEGWASRWPFFFALFAVCGSVSVLFGQDAHWDLLNYHLANPYRLLHGRLGFDLVPSGGQSFLNPIGDLPYYFLAYGLNDYPRLIAFLMGLPTAITGYFVFQISRELFAASRERLLYALLAAIVGISGVAGLTAWGTTTVEWIPTALCIAGGYFIIGYLHSATRSDRKIFLAGFLIGLAVGIKLTAASFALGAGIGLFVAADGIARRFRASLWLSLGGLLGALLTGGPWAWYLYANFGNPFFPFFNNIFPSEWFPFSARDVRFLPHNNVEWIFYPFYWAFTNAQHQALELKFRDPRLALALMATIGAGLLLGLRRFRSSDSGWVFIFVAFFVTYLAWLLQFAYVRYTVQLEALSGIIIVGTANYLARGSLARIVACCGAAGGVLALTAAPDYGHVPFSGQNFVADIPEIPPNAMVILTQNEPVSYFIPFFPADTRFVKGHPMGKTYRFEEVIADAVASHRGPLFAMDQVPGNSQEDRSRLEQFQLVRADAACAPVKVNIGTKPMQLCPLRRR